jgi:hypothetical protein
MASMEMMARGDMKRMIHRIEVSFITSECCVINFVILKR